MLRPPTPLAPAPPAPSKPDSLHVSVTPLSPVLARAVSGGIVNPRPAPAPANEGSLRMGPRRANLATLWKSGGSQVNAWTGALGMLMQEDALDEATDKACHDLGNPREAARLREAVMDWASTIFAPMEAPSGAARTGGSYLAEVTLFGIPVLTTPETVENLLADNHFAALLREKGVFDKTSVVAFLGCLPATRALTLSPQLTASLTRIMRGEMLRFQQEGTPALSTMAAAMVGEFFRLSFPASMEDTREEPVQVMVGVRLALCHRDGRPHDILGERRTVAEDEASLDAWHSLALTHVKAAHPGVFLMGDPKPLGRTGAGVMDLLVEGRLSLDAARQRGTLGQATLVREEKESGDLLTVRAADSRGQTLPPLALPWGVVAPHLHSWCRRLDERFDTTSLAP